jgi:hypothetical protein
MRLDNGIPDNGILTLASDQSVTHLISRILIRNPGARNTHQRPTRQTEHQTIEQ